MRFPALLFGLFLSVFAAVAQEATLPKQPRILILLDGSSSMLQPWEKGEQRFKAAAKIIDKLADSLYSINDQVELALRVYGHQHPAQENNCFDTRKEVMFSKDNRAQMSLRVASLNTMGVSPIAYSLKEAAENDLVDIDHYNYCIILITDGGESCGGDICNVVKILLEKKINFKPYIVSLVDYAPLRDQYECLGNYLLTTRDADIPKTVGTIVEAYRPMLKMQPIDQKIFQSAVVNAPSVLKMDIPKFEVKTEADKPAVPVKKETPKPKVDPPVAAIPKPKVDTGVKKEVPKPKEDTVVKIVTRPVPPVVEPPRTKEIPPGHMIVQKTAITTPSFSTPVVVVRSNPYIPKYTEPDPVEKPVVVATKPPEPMPELKQPAITPPVAAPPPVEKPVVAAKPPAPKPKPAIKPTTPPVQTTRAKEPKYSVEREEQKETTLEVYFTDGRGRFYETAPQVVLVDPKTSAPVHKFYRTVNASGNPDPQKLPVGVYNLTIPGKSNLLVRNIEVKENNKNKIIVQVGKASLRFEYEDDPNEPVAEFSAKVKKNFERGPMITQLCTQELEYEPGNYHITLSTQPRDQRSVDLDFDALVVIKVERPGFVHFTNTNALGKITLYYQLGDQYVQFYNLNINGNLDMQRMKLQRGNYRVSYNKTPNVPYAQETVKQFKVTSKEVTELLLD